MSDLLKRVDEYCAVPGNDISEIYIGFREFETKCLKELQARFYKEYPYNYREKMTHSTDIGKSKLSEIFNKK